MTVTNPIRKPRRWPWMVGGAIAVALLVSSVAIFNIPRETDEPTATPTETESSGPVGVDACLGGQDAVAASVLAAQEMAPQTSEGAVSYAATFGRWLYQVPFSEEWPVVAAENALDAATWEEGRESLSTDWAGPQPLKSTTINGRYRVESFEGTAAVISLALPWVVDGAVAPTRRFIPEFALAWSDGRWEVTGAQNSGIPDEELSAFGSEFSGGC